MRADYMVKSKMPSIPEQIETIKNDMCRNYCKYTDTWDEEAQGIELCESDICRDCPLGRL